MKDFENNEIYMSGPEVLPIDIDFVIDALTNGWYGQDAYKYVEKFELEFATWHNRNFALMTPNCTTAIHLILTALGIGPDDEVIVPDSTWIGSVAGVVYLGAKPIFADVDGETWCISVNKIRQLVTKKTKAIIAVDLYGNMPNLEELEIFCEEHGIFLIEDAAEAIGSIRNSRRAGNFGIASVFSFHRTKTLTTGEGGMLVLNNEKLFQRCKFLRDHGREPGKFYNKEVTYKYMPSNLSASLGYAQFQRIGNLVEKKRNIFDNYTNLFSEYKSLRFNPEIIGDTNSAWCSVVILDPKKNLDAKFVLQQFEKCKIPARPFFYPLSSLPAFKDMINGNENRINLESYKLSKWGVCLPSALNLTARQQEIVFETFKTFYP